MSIGNTKDQGNKGNNFPYQLRNLQLLSIIAGNTTGLVPPGGGLATEATQLSVLSSLQSQQEFVSTLVIDTGGVGCPGNCPVYNKIMIYDETTSTWTTTYYDANGNDVTGSIVGPLEYLNPQYTLNDILLAINSVDGKIIACDTSNLALESGNLNSINSTISNMDTVIGDIFSRQADGSQQTQIVDGSGNIIGSTDNTLDVNIKTSATKKTASFLRTTGSGTVMDAYSVSFFNSGTGDVLVDANILHEGEIVTFEAPVGYVLNNISYDATGGGGKELLIAKVI